MWTAQGGDDTIQLGEDSSAVGYYFYFWFFDCSFWGLESSSWNASLHVQMQVPSLLLLALAAGFARLVLSALLQVVKPWSPEGLDILRPLKPQVAFWR